MHSLLINSIITAHLAFVILLAMCFVISFKIKILRPIILGVLILLLLLWRATGGCPLTLWEARLLQNSAASNNLAQIGFIPYYFKFWLHINLPVKVFTFASYILAGIQLLLTVDWLLPTLKKIIILKNKCKPYGQQ